MTMSTTEANTALEHYYGQQIQKQFAEAKSIQELNNTYTRLRTKQAGQSDQAHSMLLAALSSSDTEALYNTRKQALANAQILKLINAIDTYMDHLNLYVSSKTNTRKYQQIQGFRNQLLTGRDKQTQKSAPHTQYTNALKTDYNKTPKFCATVDKIYVLNKLKAALQAQDQPPTQRLNAFRKLLNNEDSVKTLTRRRDSGLVTFIKGVAVALGGALLLAPGYLAYKKLFSRSSTKGADLINNLRTQTPNTINAAPTARP